MSNGYESALFNALMSAGLVGLVVLFFVWAVLTVITGYFLGVGIWYALGAKIIRLFAGRV